MVEMMTPPTRIKGIGEEENKEVFEASIMAGATLKAKCTREEHQPSAKFIFKHPRIRIHSPALHEK